MKRLAFIHWNILYEEGKYVLSYVQELHMFLLKRYAHVFTDALVVLHTNDIHDIMTIHTVKVMFDKVFNGNVKFIVSKNSLDCECQTFKNYFLPIVLDKYNEYDLVYYIHNKGVFNAHTDNIRVWIASLYYYNFEYFNEHLNAGLSDANIFITGGHLVSAKDKVGLDEDGGFGYIEDERVSDYCATTEIEHHFSGAFFGIFPKNYRKYYQSNKLPKSDIRNVIVSTEMHFFANNLDKSHIHHDSHIAPIECNNLTEYQITNNPYIEMDPIIRKHSNEYDVNRVFTLARGEQL